MVHENSKTIEVNFNPNHWYFKHCNPVDVGNLMNEKAIITGYLPTFKVVTYKLSDYHSAGYKVWNMPSGSSYVTLSDDIWFKLNQMPFFVDPLEVETTFLPIQCEVADLKPSDFKTDDHFWNTFGKSETESTMRWLMIECQKQETFEFGVEAKGIPMSLCLDGLVTDMGGGKFTPTRLAIRKLAGAGFYKPL